MSWDAQKPPHQPSHLSLLAPSGCSRGKGPLEGLTQHTDTEVLSEHILDGWMDGWMRRWMSGWMDG